MSVPGGRGRLGRDKGDTVPSNPVDRPPRLGRYRRETQNGSQDVIDIATAIRTARLAAPMTQDQLARAARVTRKTVIRAEQGHPVSAETLMALSSVLGLEASDLASLPPGRPGVPEPSDLVAMVLRGDEDEARRQTLHSLAEEAVGMVPEASSMAVVDLPLWERRTVKALSPDGVLPPGAGVREAASFRPRHIASLYLTLATLAGVPSLPFFLYAAAVSGAKWAGVTLTLAFSWLPTPNTELGVMASMFVMLCLFGAWSIFLFWVLDHEGRLDAVVRAGRTTAKGLDILRGRAYVTGRDGLYVLSLSGDGVETVLVPPTATSGFEVREHDGVPSFRFHMAAGREVPEGESWTLETLGFACKEMAVPCLRTGPAFLEGLSGYHRIVRPRGIEHVRPTARVPETVTT